MRFASAILLFMFAAFSFPAVYAAEVPVDIVQVKGLQKSVKFSHAAHANLECTACHHLVNGKENLAGCGTPGCHDDIKGKQGEKSLFYVMHARKGMKHGTCISCHHKIAADMPDKKTLMTGCKLSWCHPDAR
ncbi:MAG: cytochrome c3 family protein [Mailhella sp.]|nr:cytochrome c3 family protein [Mailhella sp.]